MWVVLGCYLPWLWLQIDGAPMESQGRKPRSLCCHSTCKEREREGGWGGGGGLREGGWVGERVRAGCYLLSLADSHVIQLPRGLEAMIVASDQRTCR